MGLAIGPLQWAYYLAAIYAREKIRDAACVDYRIQSELGWLLRFLVAAIGSGSVKCLCVHLPQLLHHLVYYYICK